MFVSLLKTLAFELFLCNIEVVDPMETESAVSSSNRLPLLSGARDCVVSDGSIILSSVVSILR